MAIIEELKDLASFVWYFSGGQLTTAFLDLGNEIAAQCEETAKNIEAT